MKATQGRVHPASSSRLVHHGREAKICSKGKKAMHVSICATQLAFSTPTAQDLPRNGATCSGQLFFLQSIQTG